MNEDEKRKYEALKADGHSPMKAGQILLDAKRGDRFAINWIEYVLKRQEPRQQGKG